MKGKIRNTIGIDIYFDRKVPMSRVCIKLFGSMAAKNNAAQYSQANGLELFTLVSFFNICEDNIHPIFI